MCKLSYFCCCCSLKTGAIVAAVLTLLHGISLFCLGVFLHMFLPKNISHADLIHIIGLVFVGCGVLYILTFICLALAIHKEKSFFVLPWLIFNFFLIIAVSALTFVIGLFGLFPFFVFCCLNLLFPIYLWNVVYNYYRSLRKKP